MKKVAVIGAGISGLFIANLFKRNKNYQVTIFERNSLIDLKEGYGLKLHTLQNADFLLKIHISKKVESLNISNSAALVFHHINYLRK